MQHNQLLEVVGQFSTRIRLTLCEGQIRLQGMRQMIRIAELAEHFSVSPDPAQTGAGKVHPVIALVSRDKSSFRGLALAAPIGSCQF